MKNRLIKIAIMMAVSMSVYSCHKSGVASFTPMQHEGVVVAEITEATTASFPGNPANPYDSIGAWHNEMLDYIHQHQTGTEVVDEQEISRLIGEFALQRWAYADIQIAIPVTSWNEEEGIEALQQELVLRSGLSEDGSEQLRLLLETITSHSLQANGFSYPALKDNITGLEQQWVDTPSLPMWDTSLLLMAASVARHSAHYWSNDGTLPTIEPTPSGEGQPTGKLLFKKIVRFIAVVQFDATGFIAGYAGGSLKDAAGRAAGASERIYDFFHYGVPGGW